jgi:hypothetical protein
VALFIIKTTNMPALKGNKYYMNRGKNGREKKISSPEKLLQKACEYFEYCDKHPWKKNEAIKSGDKVGKIIKIPIQCPYTIEGLCVHTGISKRTFERYEACEDYCAVTTHVREIIEANQLEGAIVGVYNANIIARKLGLTEKIESKQEIIFPTTINIIKDDGKSE